MAENVNRLQFAAGYNRNVWRVSKKLLCTTADIVRQQECVEGVKVIVMYHS